MVLIVLSVKKSKRRDPNEFAPVVRETGKDPTTEEDEELDGTNLLVNTWDEKGREYDTAMLEKKEKKTNGRFVIRTSEIKRAEDMEDGND